MSPSDTAPPGPQPRGDINTLRTLAPYLRSQSKPAMPARLAVALITLTFAEGLVGLLNSCRPKVQG